MTVQDIGEAAELETPRLRLAAVREADAEEMTVVLGDQRLHEYTGGSPLALPELRAQYRRWLAGSGKPGELWLNWVVRLRETGVAVGTLQATVSTVQATVSTVQATVTGDLPGAGPAGERAAEVAWVIGVPWQGRGYAAEAARALVAWLTAAGISDVTACISPRHRASMQVAERAGFTSTSRTVDGERVWRHQAAGDGSGSDLRHSYRVRDSDGGISDGVRDSTVSGGGYEGGDVAAGPA